MPRTPNTKPREKCPHCAAKDRARHGLRMLPTRTGTVNMVRCVEAIEPRGAEFYNAEQILRGA